MVRIACFNKDALLRFASRLQTVFVSALSDAAHAGLIVNVIGKDDSCLLMCEALFCLLCESTAFVHALDISQLIYPIKTLILDPKEGIQRSSMKLLQLICEETTIASTLLNHDIIGTDF